MLAAPRVRDPRRKLPLAARRLTGAPRPNGRPRPAATEVGLPRVPGEPGDMTSHDANGTGPAGISRSQRGKPETKVLQLSLLLWIDAGSVIMQVRKHSIPNPLALLKVVRLVDVKYKDSI